MVLVVTLMTNLHIVSNCIMYSWSAHLCKLVEYTMFTMGRKLVATWFILFRSNVLHDVNENVYF